MDNFGLDNEKEIIFAINNKTFDELNDNLKRWMMVMFPNIEPRYQKFYAKKCDPRGKPDIEISYGGEHHFISVKYGSSEMVHNSEIYKFIDILRSHYINEETINTILLSHFGDGTIDGTGKKRHNYSEIFPMMQEKFKSANLELNSDREVVVDLVDTFVFKGTYSGLNEADYIYHGNKYDGVLVSRKLMLAHIRRRDYAFMNNLHIGPLQFHPYARYVSENQGTNEYKRYKVNIKWVNLKSDLAYVNKYYV